MRAAPMKGECDGNGDKGGVGIAGGLGARRSAGVATREDGGPSVGTSVWGFKRCGAARSM